MIENRYPSEYNRWRAELEGEKPSGLAARVAMAVAIVCLGLLATSLTLL